MSENMKINYKHSLGEKAEDKITSFKGVITGVCSYLTGCHQYLVQPPSKDGDFKSGQWFDEGRLRILDEEKLDKKEVESEDNGACGVAPIK